MATSGSTDHMGSSVNHQGTPFNIGTIWVSGPISRSSPGAMRGRVGALTASTTTSWTPRLEGSVAVVTATHRVSPRSVINSPSASIALRVSPRATTDTSFPASANLAAIQPPMAPAPTTQMFMAAAMGYKLHPGQGGEMLFRQLFEPQSSTYTYLIGCDGSGEAVLIDPVLETVERDLAVLSELGLTLTYTVETHIHADHVTGASRLRGITGCRCALPERSGAAHVDLPVQEGKPIPFGGLELQPLFTPGHTDDHHSYFLDVAGAARAFTGDALLIDGCGRTDFQNGDAATLYRSVHEKLFSLPVDTLVYPGHDYQHHRVSSIGQELERNPRLGGGRSLEEFVGIMASLTLPRPKKMDLAVPANRGCGEVH